MTAQRTSLGLTIGATIGKGAAYAVHGAIASAQATGRFGQDIVAGAQAGYADKAAELRAKRDAALAAFEAAETVALKPQPQLAAPKPAAAKRSRKVAA